MDRHMQRPLRALVCTALVFVFAAIPAVASEPFPFVAMEASFAEDATLSGYARRNLRDFTAFTLGNGVPVVVKSGGSGRVRHISLCLSGGVSLASPATAGLETVALAAMARGSAGHPYREIQELLDETSTSFASGASFDLSTYSLTTLDKHFDRMFPVWADTVTAPSFTGEDVAQVLSDAKLALESKEQNPWAMTALAANAGFFEGHPYSVPPDGTKESLASFSVESMREWYRTLFVPGRMFVIAVGGFDPASLRDSLEGTIGSLPVRAYSPPPAVPALRGRDDPGPGKIVYPQSKGIAYIRGDFPAPAPADADYMAANVAMKILSDLLFAVVRDKYGATYSPGATVRGFLANYGSLSIYRTQQAEAVKKYIDEAVAALARGECVAVDPSRAEGDDPRMPLEEALEAYKALFLSAYYGSQQTVAALAAQIASSIVHRNDYRAYLLDPDRIGAVTAAGVRKAFETWILRGRFYWIVLGSGDVVDPVRPEEYRGFSE